MEKESKAKTIYIEFIRIVAILFVMFIHSGPSGHLAYSHTDSNVTFIFSLILSIISNTGVPLFWMISGAVLLGREEPMRLVYKKRMPRILITLLAFSVIRYVYDFLQGKYLAIGIKDFALRFLCGDVFVPYWFLYSYITILLAIPFLRKLIKDLSYDEWKALGILEIVFLIVFKILYIFIDISENVTLFIIEPVNACLLGYIAGNVLSDEMLKKKAVKIALSISFLVLVGLEYILTVTMGVPRGEDRVVYTDIFALPLAFCIYLIIRSIATKIKNKNETIDKIIIRLGACSFGIYLIEDYIRNAMAFICDELGKYITLLPACMVWILCSYFIGFGFVSLLRRLPLINMLL